MRALLAGLIAALPAAWVAFGPAAAQAPWPAERFNPRPLDGDVILPMPCGGRMAFRRVDVPAAPGALEDRQITVGFADPDTNFVEHVRQDYLAAPFAAPDGTRYFLIGKYEVTRDQYAAVMEQPCPASTPAGMAPASRIGWFDAVAFTFRFNEWLFANAREALPREGDALGFVRLPTETEWEYAARGGAAVSESDFRQRVFPMQQPITRYVWHFGPRSASGQAQPIGRLLPNPLGLFDILGNVGEIALDPYRVSHGERLHGQAGGFVARGGDYSTPDNRIRASLRAETPHFDGSSGRAVRLAQVGMRPVVSAVVETSRERGLAMRQAWDDTVERGRAQRELNAGRAIDPDQDADALLRALVGQTQQPDLQASLQRVQQALADERGARLNEQIAREAADGRSAYSAIDSGAILIRLMRDYDNRARQYRALADIVRQRPDARSAENRERIAGLERDENTLHENLRDTVEAYLRLANLTARAFPRAQLEAQLALWRREHVGPRFERLAAFAQLFVEQTTRQRERPTSDARALIDAIMALR